jgi:hypothetical protein
MQADISSSATSWQEEELSAATLPDKRVAHRLRRLLEQLSAAPGKPIPAACGDWAATKAAYRFFDNPRVTEHSILTGHFAATAARADTQRGIRGGQIVEIGGLTTTRTELNQAVKLSDGVGPPHYGPASWS